MTTDIKEYARILGPNVPADRSDAFFAADRDHIARIQKQLAELLKIPGVKKSFGMEQENLVTGYLTPIDRMVIGHLNSLGTNGLSNLETKQETNTRGAKSDTFSKEEKAVIAGIRDNLAKISATGTFHFSTDSDYFLIRERNPVLGLKMLLQQGRFLIQHDTDSLAVHDISSTADDWKYGMALKRFRSQAQVMMNTLPVRELTGLPPMPITGDDTPEFRHALDTLKNNPRAAAVVGMLEQRRPDIAMNHNMLMEFHQHHSTPAVQATLPAAEKALEDQARRMINLYAYAAEMEDRNEGTKNFPSKVQRVRTDLAFGEYELTQLREMNSFITRKTPEAIKALLEESSPSLGDKMHPGGYRNALKPEDAAFMENFSAHFADFEKMKRAAFDSVKNPVGEPKDEAGKKVYALQKTILMDGRYIYQQNIGFYDEPITNIKMNGKTDDPHLSFAVAAITEKARQIVVMNASNPDFARHFSKETGMSRNDFLQLKPGYCDENMIKVLRAVSSYGKPDDLEVESTAQIKMIRTLAALSNDQIGAIRDNPVRILNEGIASMSAALTPTAKFENKDPTRISESATTVYGKSIKEFQRVITTERMSGFLAGLFLEQVNLNPEARSIVENFANSLHATNIAPDVYKLKQFINENLEDINAMLPEKGRIPGMMQVNGAADDDFNIVMGLLQKLDKNKKSDMSAETLNSLTSQMASLAQKKSSVDHVANMRQFFKNFPPKGGHIDNTYLTGTVGDPTTAVARLITLVTVESQEDVSTRTLKKSRITDAAAAIVKMNPAVSALLPHQEKDWQKSMANYEKVEAEKYLALPFKKFVNQNLEALNAGLPENARIAKKLELTATLDDPAFIKAYDALKKLNLNQTKMFVSEKSALTAGLNGYMEAMNRIEHIIAPRRLAYELGATSVSFANEQVANDSSPLLVLKQALTGLAGNRVFPGTPKFDPAANGGLLKKDSPGFIAALAKTDLNAAMKLPKDIYTACALGPADIAQRIKDTLKNADPNEVIAFNASFNAKAVSIASAHLSNSGRAFKAEDFEFLPRESYIFDAGTKTVKIDHEKLSSVQHINTLENLLRNAQAVYKNHPGENAFNLQMIQIQALVAKTEGILGNDDFTRFDLALQLANDPSFIDQIAADDRIALLQASMTDPLFASRLKNIPEGMTREQYIEDLSNGIDSFTLIIDVLQKNLPLTEELNTHTRAFKAKTPEQQAAYLAQPAQQPVAAITTPIVTEATSTASTSAIAGQAVSAFAASATASPSLSENAPATTASIVEAGQAITPYGATSTASAGDTGGPVKPMNRAEAAAAAMQRRNQSAKTPG